MPTYLTQPRRREKIVLSPDILRTDSEILAVLPDVSPGLVSRQGFPHVEGILTVGAALDVVAVVTYNAAEDRVARGWRENEVSVRVV